MAAFQFNFSVEESGKTGSITHFNDVDEKLEESRTSSADADIQAEEIPFLPFFHNLDHITPARYMVPGSGVELRYITFSNLQDMTKTGTSDGQVQCSDLTTLMGLVEEKHTDLIPGVYEGGFKVWECAFNLVDYLASSQVDLLGLKVLELGCGAALPGLFAMKSGASCVHFQDYNPEVLRFMTMPNVALNHGLCSRTEDKLVIGQGVETGQCYRSENKCKFFSGPWDGLPSLQKSSKYPPYDLIVSSETIYSLDSQPSLLRALKELVCPVRGKVLLAAKQYYFGVGGSVQTFQDLVEKDEYFTISTHEIVDVSIPRAILELVPKHCAIANKCD